MLEFVHDIGWALIAPIGAALICVVAGIFAFILGVAWDWTQDDA